MEKKQPRQMRSLGDMPRGVIICEVIGVILLIMVYLTVNDHIALPEFLRSKNALMAMAFTGLACLIPAAVNIVWRAVSTLPAIGIDSKTKTEKKEPQDKNEKRQ